jgi:hypothetical protein
VQRPGQGDTERCQGDNTPTEGIGVALEVLSDTSNPSRATIAVTGAAEVPSLFQPFESCSSPGFILVDEYVYRGLSCQRSANCQSPVQASSQHAGTTKGGCPNGPPIREICERGLGCRLSRMVLCACLVRMLSSQRRTGGPAQFIGWLRSHPYTQSGMRRPTRQQLSVLGANSYDKPMVFRDYPRRIWHVSVIKYPTGSKVRAENTVVWRRKPSEFGSYGEG